MSQVRAGSIEAFEELYDRFCDRAYRTAWGICRDTGRAEEAVQEAFMSIWRSRDAYQSERGTVAVWLLSTVRYRAIDRARHDDRHTRRRATEDALHALPAPSDVTEQLIAKQETQRLQDLLTELPDVQREVITLAFYGQLTHSEIATHLGLPPGTVKGRMRLGLNKLREAFDQAVA
jgi:RNA polymerase sigma-70 factor, ECF subfamily